MMHYGWFRASFVSILFPLLWAGCSSTEEVDQSGATGAPAVAVEILVVETEPLEHKISVTGSVLANESVELRSETSGRLVELNFEEGAMVQKGQLLAKINDRDLRAQLRTLVLQDSLLNRELYRKRQLLDLNAISREEYDQVETELASLRAEQEVVQTQIDRTDITAPFSGKVGLRSVSEGAYIEPATFMATLQQINPVKIEFAVPEKYRDHLQPGTAVEFTVTGSDSLFSAEVYAVESRIDPVTRSITARARSQNSEGLLYPGAFASMEIILQKIEDAILVPSEAVNPQIDGHHVYVVKNGLAHLVNVDVGVRTERRTQITSGLSPGDSLATTGLLQLQDSTAVNIQ